VIALGGRHASGCLASSTVRFSHRAPPQAGVPRRWLNFPTCPSACGLKYKPILTILAIFTQLPTHLQANAERVPGTERRASSGQGSGFDAAADQQPCPRLACVAGLAIQTWVRLEGTGIGKAQSPPNAKHGLRKLPPTALLRLRGSGGGILIQRSGRTRPHVAGGPPAAYTLSKVLRTGIPYGWGGAPIPPASYYTQSLMPRTG
jgi:hypothetical protein